MDLQNLSLDDLRKLGSQLEKEISTREREELQRARQEILSIAERVGMPLKSLLTMHPKVQKEPSKVAVQFRHPDDPNKSWTGRGRQPRWIGEFTNAGGSLDELRVKQA